MQDEKREKLKQCEGVRVKFCSLAGEVNGNYLRRTAKHCQKKELHVYANDSICQKHCYLYVCVYSLGMDRKSDPHSIHRGKTEPC